MQLHAVESVIDLAYTMKKTKLDFAVTDEPSNAANFYRSGSAKCACVGNVE